MPDAVRNCISQLRVAAVVAAIAVPAAAVTICLPGRGRRRAFARRAANRVFRLCGIFIDVRHLERLPDGPCIVVANHASYLDGVALTAALPPRFTFLIKKEMSTVPVVGLLLRRLGSEFVARADPKAGASAASRLVRAARNGDAIGVFPEGTFQRLPGLREFRLGAFMAAVRGDLPLVPVAIAGTRRLLPAGRCVLGTGRVIVTIAVPLRPSARGRPHAEQLRDQARRAILEHCGEAEAATPATPGTPLQSGDARAS